jgi:4-amino-4-deoxy-L-arabinose transferase-like glycosyltransferase
VSSYELPEDGQLKRVFVLRQPLWVILFVSVLLRVLAALYLGNTVQDQPGIFDQISYHNLALRLVAGYGFSFGSNWWPATAADAPTAHWSFLYTLYLAAVYTLFGPHPLVARLLQAVAVGVLMPWLLYRIGCRLLPEWPEQQDNGRSLPPWLRGHTLGLAAAALAAIYIYFVYYAAALVTESFYIVALLWVFDQSLQISQSAETRPRQWLLLGVALAIAVLLRQLVLLVIPFLLLWLWWVTQPRPVRPRPAWLLLPLLVVVLAILPWTVRNYLAFDQFVLLNTNAGFAFYWGNHPVHGNRFVPILTAEMGSYYSLIPPELLHLDEAALDKALLKRAVTGIAADPGRFLVLSLSRIPHYFVFWPSADSGTISNVSRVGSFGLFLPLMIYGLFLSWRYAAAAAAGWSRSPFFLLYLFVAVYTAIHVFTWTLIRYRLPVDAVLLLFAGLALLELSSRLQAHFRVGPSWKSDPTLM